MTLSRISFRQAKHFFKAYEHLGNCGLGVWHWAASEAGKVIGVVSFGTTCFARSRGLISQIASRFNLGVYQVCRGATNYPAPPNAPSQMVSAAMRELRQERGDCLIVAYSDRDFSEVGTIYQACNALYTGLTDPKNQSNYLIDGRIMNGWLVRKRYGTRAMSNLRRLDLTVVKIPLTPKYRYVFVQACPRKKSKVLAAFAPHVRPYPSRRSENIGAMDISRLINERADTLTQASREDPARPARVDGVSIATSEFCV